MTDNEIKKALGCCMHSKWSDKCSECFYAECDSEKGCVKELLEDALDLINRQQAEIERLKAEVEAKEYEYSDMVEQRNNVESHLETTQADAVEKVASILAVMLDTPCNFSPTDEWLAYVCDYCFSCDCEHKECWKQLFKHWDERKCGDAE